MQVRARMYRQGLGDCFLLTFGDGADARHVLIDCGTLGSTTTGVKMKDVVGDIVTATGGHLHLLIATHEHKDHVSGFLSQQPQFDGLQIDNVWLAWTENPEDELAQQIAKYQGDLVTSLRPAAAALDSRSRKKRAPLPQEMARLGAGVRKLLEFHGEVELAASGLARTVHEAMTYVHGRAAPDFLEPGDLRQPDWLPGVRVYVLGPPRDPAALAHLGEHGSPELYELAARQARDLAASVGFFTAAEALDDYWEGLEPDQRQELLQVLPFDLRHRLESSDERLPERVGSAYFSATEAWRRVDYDWLGGAADLALQLDGQTNNTSLALAFELGDGRVLLFPADAQAGNWLSWHQRPAAGGGTEPRTWKVLDAGGAERQVSVPDLLARTVLYKVGHHASHNATVKEKGLELMTHPELTAIIPVDRSVAMNKRPQWKMPARELYRNLISKAKGRVLRSDVGWARPDPDFPDLFTPEEWNGFTAEQQAAEQRGRIRIDVLHVDYELA